MSGVEISYIVRVYWVLTFGFPIERYDVIFGNLLKAKFNISRGSDRVCVVS